MADTGESGTAWLGGRMSRPAGSSSASVSFPGTEPASLAPRKGRGRKGPICLTNLLALIDHEDKSAEICTASQAHAAARTTNANTTPRLRSVMVDLSFTSLTRSVVP